jgi:hypothetical protein
MTTAWPSAAIFDNQPSLSRCPVFANRVARIALPRERVRSLTAAGHDVAVAEDNLPQRFRCSPKSDRSPESAGQVARPQGYLTIPIWVELLWAAPHLRGDNLRNWAWNC